VQQISIIAKDGKSAITYYELREINKQKKTEFNCTRYI